MGEYAIRKSDNAEVKIGTCESMYYLRYEDREKVTAQEHSLDPAKTQNLFWRLPFPDEDNVSIGNYEQYNRGQRLYKTTTDGYCENFEEPELIEHPGTMQMSHESGLLLNIPCYHGEKLPELGDAKAFWNGKSHAYELAFIKNTVNGIIPIVKCRHCNKMWSFDWEDIKDYIPEPMLSRLTQYM
jgi:hypothetical protein